jgi:exo-1,4-beta-D-glucosaminidase
MLDGMCTNKCELTVSQSGDNYKATVTNPTDKVAFMIRLTAKNQNGQLLCPAYWSDNYLTLAPGETRTVTCTVLSLPNGATVTIQIAQ